MPSNAYIISGQIAHHLPPAPGSDHPPWSPGVAVSEREAISCLRGALTGAISVVAEPVPQSPYSQGTASACVESDASFWVPQVATWSHAACSRHTITLIHSPVSARSSAPHRGQPTTPVDPNQASTASSRFPDLPSLGPRISAPGPTCHLRRLCHALLVDRYYSYPPSQLSYLFPFFYRRSAGKRRSVTKP